MISDARNQQSMTDDFGLKKGVHIQVLDPRPGTSHRLGEGRQVRTTEHTCHVRENKECEHIASFVFVLRVSPMTSTLKNKNNLITRTTSRSAQAN